MGNTIPSPQVPPLTPLLPVQFEWIKGCVALIFCDQTFVAVGVYAKPNYFVASAICLDPANAQANANKAFHARFDDGVTVPLHLLFVSKDLGICIFEPAVEIVGRDLAAEVDINVTSPLGTPCMVVGCDQTGTLTYHIDIISALYRDGTVVGLGDLGDHGHANTGPTHFWGPVFDSQTGQLFGIVRPEIYLPDGMTNLWRSETVQLCKWMIPGFHLARSIGAGYEIVKQPEEWRPPPGHVWF